MHSVQNNLSSTACVIEKAGDIELKLCYKTLTRDMLCRITEEVKQSSRTVSGLTVRFCESTFDSFQLVCQQISPNLTSLVCDNTKLDEQSVQTLAAAIRQCNSLQCLSLRKCGLGLSGISHITQSLAEWCNVTQRIDLSLNQLSSGSLQELTNALSTSERLRRALRELKLKACDIQDEGMSILAPGIILCDGLQVLDVGFNSFGPKACSLLAKALSGKHLELLCLDHTRSARTSATVILAVSSTVKKVDISFVSLNTCDIEYVADALLRCQHLQWIHIEEEVMNPEFIVPILQHYVLRITQVVKVVNLPLRKGVCGVSNLPDALQDKPNETIVRYCVDYNQHPQNVILGTLVIVGPSQELCNSFNQRILTKLERLSSTETSGLLFRVHNASNNYLAAQFYSSVLKEKAVFIVVYEASSKDACDVYVETIQAGDPTAHIIFVVCNESLGPEQENNHANITLKRDCLLKGSSNCSDTAITCDGFLETCQDVVPKILTAQGHKISVMVPAWLFYTIENASHACDPVTQWCAWISRLQTNAVAERYANVPLSTSQCVFATKFMHDIGFVICTRFCKTGPHLQHEVEGDVVIVGYRHIVQDIVVELKSLGVPNPLKPETKELQFAHDSKYSWPVAIDSESAVSKSKCLTGLLLHYGLLDVVYDSLDKACIFSQFVDPIAPEEVERQERLALHSENGGCIWLWFHPSADWPNIARHFVPQLSHWHIKGVQCYRDALKLTVDDDTSLLIYQDFFGRYVRIIGAGKWPWYSMTIVLSRIWKILGGAYVGVPTQIACSCPCGESASMLPDIQAFAKQCNNVHKHTFKCSNCTAKLRLIAALQVYYFIPYRNLHMACTASVLTHADAPKAAQYWTRFRALIPLAPKMQWFLISVPVMSVLFPSINWGGSIGFVPAILCGAAAHPHLLVFDTWKVLEPRDVRDMILYTGDVMQCMAEFIARLGAIITVYSPSCQENAHSLKRLHVAVTTELCHDMRTAYVQTLLDMQIDTFVDFPLGEQFAAEIPKVLHTSSNNGVGLCMCVHHWSHVSKRQAESNANTVGRFVSTPKRFCPPPSDRPLPFPDMEAMRNTQSN